MRKYMQRSGIRAAVKGLYAYAKILGRRFAVLDEHVEIAVLIENAGVKKFELESLSTSPAVFVQ